VEYQVLKARSQWGGAKVVLHRAVGKLADSPSVAWSVRSRISTLTGKSRYQICQDILHGTPGN
jgi:hypothetical protein